MVDEARNAPTPECATIYEDDRMRLLVRVCAALQAHHGTEPFFLSARRAGEVVGVSRTIAARMIKTLAFDRILSLERKGTLRDRNASEYRFLGG